MVYLLSHDQQFVSRRATQSIAVGLEPRGIKFVRNAQPTADRGLAGKLIRHWGNQLYCCRGNLPDVVAGHISFVGHNLLRLAARQLLHCVQQWQQLLGIVLIAGDLHSHNEVVLCLGCDLHVVALQPAAVFGVPH